MGSGQPWVPHGDSITQQRSEQWLNVMRGPWAPHVGRMRLLELHGLTGAGAFEAAGATRAMCRGWVTASCRPHHLGDEWVALLGEQNLSHFASEGCRVVH